MWRNIGIKRQTIIVVVLVITAIFYAKLYSASVAVHRVSPAEETLLQQDYSALIAPYLIPLNENTFDNQSVLSGAETELQQNGLQLADLTPAEQQFMGLIMTHSGPKGYWHICYVVAYFSHKHARMPRNAADIVLGETDPEKFILDYPTLVNPVTGKLYDTFKSEPAPLGIRLERYKMDGRARSVNSAISAILGIPGHRVEPRWRMIVYREDGKHVLFDTTLKTLY